MTFQTLGIYWVLIRDAFTDQNRKRPWVLRRFYPRAIFTLFVFAHFRGPFRLLHFAFVVGGIRHRFQNIKNFYWGFVLILFSSSKCLWTFSQIFEKNSTQSSVIWKHLFKDNDFVSDRSDYFVLSHKARKSTRPISYLTEPCVLNWFLNLLSCSRRPFSCGRENFAVKGIFIFIQFSRDKKWKKIIPTKGCSKKSRYLYYNIPQEISIDKNW